MDHEFILNLSDSNLKGAIRVFKTPSSYVYNERIRRLSAFGGKVQKYKSII